MAKTKPFDEHLAEYEQWFSDNHYVFESELEAIRNAMPGAGKGVEIGVGSGIFAVPLGINDGIEPSKNMRDKARERGLHVISGVAENLPLVDGSYDVALMVTTVCFVDDIGRAFSEVYRILKEDGHFIIGFVDRDSPVGRHYLSFKEKSIFYKEATFYSTEEIFKHLRDNNFTVKSTFQTVFGLLDEINRVQVAEKGYGKGSFVVIEAKKKEGHL